MNINLLLIKASMRYKRNTRMQTHTCDNVIQQLGHCLMRDTQPKYIMDHNQLILKGVSCPFKIGALIKYLML